MPTFLQTALNWLEVWALLIPLSVLYFRRRQPPFLKPVIVYLWGALFFNLVGDIIGDFKRYLPFWLQTNNPLYNVHSLLRFACFSSFFMALNQPYFVRLKKGIPAVTLVLVIINFLFVDNFMNPNRLSGNLLTIDANFLLVYCLLYYLAQLKDEVGALATGPDFWVATGLCIYVVVNFFVFLFYIPLIDQAPLLAIDIWNIHNISYLIMCLFIAKAFYAFPRPQYSH